MPLCLADIRRLRALGYRVSDFVVVVHGERRLRNVDGRCFFLGEAGCRVYDVRPLGCGLYPLVMDNGGRVLVDPGCRFSERFSIEDGDVRRLRGFIKLLRRERRRVFS